MRSEQSCGVIAGKLDLLARYLDKVKTLVPASIQDLERNWERQKALERILQVRYQPMVRFRNFIVHRYEEVDLGVLYGILTRHLDDFGSFMREIQDHVRRSG